MSRNIALILLFTFLTLPISAQTLPQFAFPLNCELDKTCWIVNHVDVDPSENAKDFTCGTKTYNDHKGTDIAIRSRAEMEQGVAVLAAKDGKILRVRNGESDTVKSKIQLQDIISQNKDCGNGILIDHGQALQTFYCHMKENSLIVKPGDTVKQGQKIGEIGQSGRTEYPHLHISVIWEGAHIDPFTGHIKEDGCDQFKDNMWNPDIAYQPITLYDGGILDVIPNFPSIRNGEQKPQTLSTNAEALIYWIALYQVQKDDEIEMVLRDPNGNIFKGRTEIMEKNRMRQYFYTGRKTTKIKLIPGTYKGTTTIRRKNTPTIIKEHAIRVE